MSLKPDDPDQNFGFKFLKILPFGILPLNSVYWSQMIRFGDLDCYLQGHIAIQTSINSFSLSKNLPF